MPIEETPRIRRTALPDNALLVLRGWDKGMPGLAADARRFRSRFPGWRRFGVSGFVCEDADGADLLCKDQFQRYAEVRVFHRAGLEAAGVEVVPTFRTPHVTLAHERLDVLLFALRRCDHEDIVNPHHREA
jgi:hypothetical protein